MNITSLPYDALYQIFDYAIPVSLDGRSILKYEAPLNISHTCRTWRQLALSNGHIWARFLLLIKAQTVKLDIRMLSLL